MHMHIHTYTRTLTHAHVEACAPCASQGELSALVSSLMYTGEMLADSSNAHMIRLLCWDDHNVTRQVRHARSCSALASFPFVLFTPILPCFIGFLWVWVWVCEGLVSLADP